MISLFLAHIEIWTCLPDSTLSLWIHPRSNWTSEISSKIIRIAERTLNSELPWRMVPCQNSQFERFWSVFRAPTVRRRYPKHLFGTVLQSWKLCFFAVPFDPVVVGQISFFDATVVCYILSLSVYAVEL